MVGKTSFKHLTRSIRETFSNGSEAARAEIETLLRNADTGVDIADAAFRRIKLTKRNGVLFANEVHLSKFAKILRSGDLVRLLKVAGIKHTVTVAQKKAFTDIMGETAETTLHSIKEMSRSLKKKKPHLDVTDDTMSSMSKAAKAEVQEIEKAVSKKFYKKPLVKLTLGTILVTSTGFVMHALRERKGCWMITTIDQKNSSCKIQAFSCDKSISDKSVMCRTPSIQNYYNDTLQLMNIFQQGNEKELAKLKNYLTIPTDQFDLMKLLENNFDDISKYFQDPNNRLQLEPCSLTDNRIEGAGREICRMCDPAANPKSTAFINPMQYAENITFVCVANPNVLDVISDIVVTTGVNLWDTVSFPGVLRTFKYVVLAILIFMLLTSIVIPIYRIFNAPQQQGYILHQDEA